MKNERKTKAELIEELAAARGRLRELETSTVAPERAAEGSEESEAKFRNVVESSPMGIHMYELAPDGRLIFVGANPAADEILGVDNSQFIGKTIEEAFPPLADTEVPERYRRAAAEGELWHTEQIAYEDERIQGAFAVTAFQTSPGRMAAMFLDVTERKRAEEALRESEEKYSNLFHYSKDAIIIHDLEGTILDSNEQASDLFGYAQEEFTSLTIQDLHPPEALPGSREAFRRISQEGLIRFEIDFRKKDGSIFPAEVSSSLFEIAGRKVIQGIPRDITERKRAEEVLRESEEKYHGLADNIPVGVFRSTADRGGRLLSVNPALARMFGYEKPEDMAKTRVVDFYAEPKARKEFINTISSAGVVTDYEVQFKRADGSTFLGSLNARAVNGPDGNVAYFDGVLEDITERKRAEEALRESEQEIRRAEHEKAVILRSMVEHVVYHDADLKILWANEAAAASVAASPESLVGRYCYEIWRGRQQPCPGCPVTAALETGGGHEGEITTPDGRVWFVRGYAVQDETGDITGAVEVTLEVTERKRAEEALRQTAAENEALLEAVPDLMFVIDKEGNYVDFKRAEADLFALPPETIIGKNIRDTGLRPEEEREIFARLRETLRTGATTTVGYNVQTPRGLGLYEARIAKLKDDEVLVLVREITERKEAEEALQKEKRFSESLMSSLPGIFYVFDTEGRFRWWNENLEAVTGYTAGEVSRMRATDFFRGRDKEIVTDRIAQAFSEGYATAEAKLHTKDGAAIPYFFSGKRVEIHGKKYLMGMGVDLTELARAQEAPGD
ncbi:MAG: PAS domain S-box protein [Candidatus Coatesbacteria bacterium]|nr:MAG: PAS domain S-box protein [Candidatus Coatesbacteria bacterium]